MSDLLDTLESMGAARCVLLSDAPTGLRAAIVIDDLSLGPAAGGVRTRQYASLRAAVSDAAQLARAMTLKCALAGLAAGGGKAVVLDHPDLDRARAFEVLGRRIEELGGLFRTAGDLGTTAADLQTMATQTAFVHTEERDLAAAVGRGMLRCVEACAAERDRSLAGLRVAIQGAGAIGAAVARALSEAGAVLKIADLDDDRARGLAAEVGAEAVGPERILLSEVDLVAPCAVGGAVTMAVASSMRAWAVCGAANNILASNEVGLELTRRQILHVPDVIASAGAVIAGIGRTVMGLPDTTPLIDRLGSTAQQVVREAHRTGEPAERVAELMARRLIAEASNTALATPQR